ncbi:MAG: TIGR03618 family F420-dependent PPOX class oxidoreductase [Nitriliruptorales bacterium]|nr:TIGR03618 family F420-dependent PPOX class oxidoreductase [Nitriliruptorales bacterium]
MLLPPDAARAFIADRHRGVLVTLKSSDGRPQLSNVVYALIDDRIRVSVTDSRAKTHNLRRDPRVSLHVASGDFWTYVVAEGDAELSPVASEPGDDTCRSLLLLYETARGEAHPDPQEFAEAMVADRRLEVSFHLTHLYPTS